MKLKNYKYAYISSDIIIYQLSDVPLFEILEFFGWRIVTLKIFY